MSEIPEDLKSLCSKFLAPLDVGGGQVDATEFWSLIERIARAEAWNATFRLQLAENHKAGAEVNAKVAELEAENEHLKALNQGRNHTLITSLEKEISAARAKEPTT